jgi:hypothetical protein
LTLIAELRIEEYARLNDVRKHKIEALEQQIRSLGATEGKISEHLEIVPSNTKKYTSETFKGGDNLFEVNVHGAVLSKAGAEHICKKSPDFFNPASLVSFISIDFYDFETEVSCIGIGLKPIYNHTSKFSVLVDDFLLSYLESGKIMLNLNCSNGTEYYPIGHWYGI